MRLLSWNCQGLGNPWTGRSLRKIVKEKDPMVCFLMETRLDKEGFENLYSNLPFQNKVIVKNPNAGGGLALLWKKDINLEIINYTVNHVLALVTEEDGFKWYLTGFYGWPEAQNKEKSWKLLQHLKTFVEGPWMVIGDFNAFLHASEKQSTRPPNYAQVEAFREALDSCQLQDIGYRGYPFTWNNKRPGDANTRIRLDRGVANEEWRLRGKSFKFEEVWLLSNECEEAVKEAWGRSGDGAHGLFSIRNKIHACGLELTAWGSAKPDEVALKELQKRLDMLNEVEASEENRVEFLDVSKQMDDLLQKQEIYWAQRSRISWMKHGDRNTKIFHSKASQRRKKNHISGIQNAQGQWVEEVEEVAEVASEYFNNIFSAGVADQMGECLNAVPHKVTNNMLEVLSGDFTAEEVKVALFQMGPTKALGPDGMNALFYQKFWHIVGDDVISAVLDFLNNGNMSPEVLANRLKQVLPDIISPT
ncbi:uncharacterized protein LOC142609101 [Castanea sativa]|uniref:uncharacterized protein LOC142609101 n=1 Tax=Castanea sativa TaxID=21020 RepID=UPI003F64DC68